MITPHNNAALGDIAKTVLMPGDPLRAKYIAENFLDDARLVNTVRNMFAYTGTYKGVPVTVMASGMGIPSIGIYSYELYTYYGVENIIRIGSAGSYSERLQVRDVVLAESAFSYSTYAERVSCTKDRVIYPSQEINDVILAKAQELGIDCKLGKVHSADAFYNDSSAGTWQQLRDETGSECVEMESFGLFHNAHFTGHRAACLLTISDAFYNQVALSAEERQNTFTQMMRLALESAIVL